MYRENEIVDDEEHSLVLFVYYTWGFRGEWLQQPVVSLAMLPGWRIIVKQWKSATTLKSEPSREVQSLYKWVMFRLWGCKDLFLQTWSKTIFTVLNLLNLNSTSTKYYNVQLWVTDWNVLNTIYLLSLIIIYYCLLLRS